MNKAISYVATKERILYGATNSKIITVDTDNNKY